VFDKKQLKNLDFVIFITLITIILLGIVIIGSATHIFDGGSLRFIKTQIIAFVIGLIAMFFIIMVDYNEIGKYYKLIYIINIIMLFAVLAIGVTKKGAQSWITIGGFGFQPSEFAKIAVIITLAKHLEDKEGKLNTIRDIIPILIHIGIPIILILLQPDLGTALVFIVILIGMLFAAGLNTKFIYGGMGAGLAFIPIAWNFLKDYQKKRILVFLNPNLDPLGSGYNVIQSKIAVGSGQFFGKGLFQGTQNKLNFIPEKHTDFIFSVLGEELGFIGTVSLLILYLILITRSLRIARLAKDSFGSLIVVGVISMIVFQIFENMGMAIGIMPVTGIPLPFMSYGGTSLIAYMMGIGLVLNVGMRRQKINF